MLISSPKLYMFTLGPLDFYLSNIHTCTDTGKHTQRDNTYWSEYMAHFSKSPQTRLIFQCRLLSQLQLQLGLRFILFMGQFSYKSPA